MPLTNTVIIKLNEITTMIPDKSNLSESDVEEIKSIFRVLVEDGQMYNVDEIEYWFENEGSWPKKSSRIRIANISSYIQDKYQQTAHLRILPDNDDGCCGDSGHDEDDCGCSH